MLEEALAIYEDLADQSGQAEPPLGARRLPHVLRHRAAAAEPLFRRSLELRRASGRRTMEAWSLDVLSTAPPLREDDPAAADASAHAVRHFREAGDVSGITLTLDVLSVVALAGGQRRRRVGSGVLRGRSWPSAEPASPRGTRIFALLPSDVRNVRAPELETLAAEGAALCLSETVAYALGEQDPSGDDATSTWGR